MFRVVWNLKASHFDEKKEQGKAPKKIVDNDLHTLLEAQRELTDELKFMQLLHSFESYRNNSGSE